jgi:hypothetical protein
MLVTVARGQTSTEVQHWLDQELHDALTVPRIDGFGVGWSSEEYSTLSAEELTKLGTEVTGHPDHPRKLEYELAKKRQVSGPTVTRHLLFCEGDGAWRYNTDREDGSFVDVTMTAGRAWQLAPQSLKIFDPKLVDPSHPEQDVRAEERVFRPMLNGLFYGGIGFQGADLTIRDIAASEGHWSAVYGRPPELEARRRFSVRLSGRWDTNLSRGFVEASEIVESGFKPDSVGARDLYKDWRQEGDLKRWVCRRMERYMPDGRLTRVLTLGGVVSWPAGGFEALTAIPPTEGADAIRGTTVFRSITDFREQTVTHQTASGAPIVTPMPPTSPGRQGWIERAGWALLAVLSTAFAAIWLRRRLRMRTARFLQGGH